MAYITQQDLEDRLSAAVVRRILDDDGDGTADTNPVARAIEDAESMIEGFLTGVYETPFAGTVQNEVKRLCLDVACAYLSMRAPEYVRVDATELMRMARASLKDLREAKTRLNTASPAPANVGGSVISGNAADPTPICHTWRGGFGVF